MKRLILLLPILFYSCLDKREYTEERHIVTEIKDTPHNEFIDGIGNRSYLIHLDNGDSIKVKRKYDIGDTVVYRFYKVD
jgi:hypothetical protein